MRFEVLSAVLLRIQVFSDVTLLHWAHISKHFERSYCLHLQCHADQDKGMWSFSVAETIHQSAQHHITETIHQSAQHHITETIHQSAQHHITEIIHQSAQHHITEYLNL